MSDLNTTKPQTSTTEPKQRKGNAMDNHILLLLGVTIFIFVSMSLAKPAIFPSLNNLSSMAFQLSEIGILTLGMMLTMLIGGIDLSVNSTANLAAILAGMYMTHFIPPGAFGPMITVHIFLAILVALLVGSICGAFNGWLVGYVGVPAILATLSTMTLYMGIAVGVTKGSSISGYPEAVLFIGNGSFLGIPMPTLIFMATIVAVWFLLNRTTFGFKIYMLGTNPLASQFSGINNPQVTIKTFMITGLLSALTGIVALARTNSANADYGTSYILMTILISVLGGIAVSGGFGKIWGVVIALVALQFLSTGFNMLLVRHGGSNFFRDFAWGAVLLLVTAITGSTGAIRRLILRR